MDNLYDIRTVQSLLKRHGFTFSKGLGQNFLIDPDVCPDMVRLSGVNRDSLALEIGPGVGVLTRELARAAGKVVTMELDGRLLPVLEETLDGCSNITVIHGDAMELDLHALIAAHRGNYSQVHLCANLPYYITSPLLMRLLEERLALDTITVMVQKEAARRLCAPVGSRDSGAVTVAVRYYCDPKLLFEVPREAFLPAPKVDSAVIRLAPRSEPAYQPQNEQFFFRMVKAAFAQRRKTALNSLSAGLGIGKEQIAAALEAMDLDARIRPEALNLEQLTALSDILYQETL